MNNKTYGFMVAIESDVVPTETFIAHAISNYMDSDDNYKEWGEAGVEVTAMGEIDLYDEEGVPLDNLD